MGLISGIHKATYCGCYIPLSIVGYVTSVKKLLRLSRIYPGLPPVVDMPIVMIEGYPSLWDSVKNIGILTCEGKITFDGASERWPFFRIEVTIILIQRGLFKLLSLASMGDPGITPPHLYFQYKWIGVLLKSSWNNSFLR